MKKTWKENGSSILMCLFEIIVGILLLVNPLGFTTGIIIACGILLLVLGLVSVVKYFRMDPETAAQTQALAKGLILLAAGWFCAFRSHWFLVTFPVLAVIYGIGILVAGLGKLQWTVDLLRRKRKKWFLAAISAAVSLVCAVVILRNPFTSSTVLWMFTGASLLVEALLDLVTLFLNSRKPRAPENIVDAKPAAQAPEPEEEAPEAE